jgi:hypothetical protein
VGIGRVLENGTEKFKTYVAAHSIVCIPGARSIIIVDIHQVGSSCGFSVPFYDFKEFRPVLNDFFANKEKKFKAGKTEESMDRYVKIFPPDGSTDSQQILGIQECMEYGWSSWHEERAGCSKKRECAAHQEDDRPLCAGTNEKAESSIVHIRACIHGGCVLFSSRNRRRDVWIFSC